MPDRRASEPTRALTGASIALLLAGLAGCAPTGSMTATPGAATGPATAAPTTGAPSLATSPTPVATPPAGAAPSRPAGTLAWPTEFDIELTPGTYFSSPPFNIPFTIRVGEPGWFSGHADPEFFDLLRFDGLAVHELPSRMIAFGDLDHVRGPSGPVGLAGLSPEAALAVLAERADLDAGNVVPISLLGLDGAWLDVHSDTSNNPIAGRGSVELRQGPQLDIRMVLLGYRGGMLMVGVLAPPGGLEAAWEAALPILRTVDIEE